MKDEVEAFIALERRVPESFDELKSTRPRVAQLAKRLSGESIIYEKVGKNSCRLVFAGPDQKVGTADDFISRPELRLRETWDMLEQERRSTSTSVK